jgi:thiamine biosynthesis lipoprotein
MRSFLSVLVILTLHFFLSACQKETALHTATKNSEMMSTIVRITVVAETANKADRLADSASDFLRSLSACFNIYDSKSEISGVNANAWARFVPLGPELQEVFQAAERAHRMTDGYFDVTVGPLVKLWKEAKKKGELPSEKEIQTAKALVGFKDVRLERAGVRFDKEGMIVDLGGIAKGYLLHRVSQFLKEQGAVAGLVDIGGDVYAWGRKPDGKSWRIAVRHPRDQNRYLRILDISGKALLTSGDYERFFIKEGKRYSHIINPFSGRPDSDVISVTVIGKEIMAIDGLSAGLLAMGSSKATNKCKEFRRQDGSLDFIVVWEEGAGPLRMWSTLK